MEFKGIERYSSLSEEMFNLRSRGAGVNYMFCLWAA